MPNRREMTVVFFIEIYLPDINMEGMEALDFRRQLRLPDGTSIRTDGSSRVMRRVEEDWARKEKIFKKTAKVTRSLLRDHLEGTDVIEATIIDDTIEPQRVVRLREDMPLDRVITLWRKGVGPRWNGS
jgi:hypothetical protein